MTPTSLCNEPSSSQPFSDTLVDEALSQSPYFARRGVLGSKRRKGKWWPARHGPLLLPQADGARDFTPRRRRPPDRESARSRLAVGKTFPRRETSSLQHGVHSGALGPHACSVVRPIRDSGPNCDPSRQPRRLSAAGAGGIPSRRRAACRSRGSAGPSIRFRLSTAFFICRRKFGRFESRLLRPGCGLAMTTNWPIEVDSSGSRPDRVPERPGV